MANIRSALKGLHNDQHREAVGRLIEEGWQGSRTGSGHIRLVHEDAARPIYASSTPSDRNAFRSLERSARLSLKLGTSTCINASVPVSQVGRPATLPDALVAKNSPRQGEVAKKKNRWTKEEKLARKINAGLISDAVKKVRQADPAHIEASPPAPKPQTHQKVQTVKHTLPSEAETTVNQPVASMAFSRSVTSAAISSQDVTSIDADMLDLAMKIVTGGFRQIAITQGMVGGSLLFDGEVFLTGGASSQALIPAPGIASQAAAPRMKAVIADPVEDKPAAAPAKPVGSVTAHQSAVLKSLRGFSQPAKCRDIAEGYHGRQVTAHEIEVVRHMLTYLTDAALAQKVTQGRFTAYIALPVGK